MEFLPSSLTWIDYSDPHFDCKSNIEDSSLYDVSLATLCITRLGKHKKWYICVDLRTYVIDNKTQYHKTFYHLAYFKTSVFPQDISERDNFLNMFINMLHSDSRNLDEEIIRLVHSNKTNWTYLPKYYNLREICEAELNKYNLNDLLGTNKTNDQNNHTEL